MKEQRKFFGVRDWSVPTVRTIAVQYATSEARSVGTFDRSPLVNSNEVSGVTTFKIFQATPRVYARFCTALERENQRLHEQELEIAKYKRNHPPVSEIDFDEDNIVPITRGIPVMDTDEELEELVAGA
jgi:hypothetical protein